MVFMGWGGGSIYPDPRQNWHSASAGGKGSNSIAYSNPQVDTLIDKANLEFDTKKRTKMLQEIGKILYEDVPYIFMVERDYVIMGFNSRIKSPKWIFNYGNVAAKEIFYQ
jgi:microcin C transport system substrate-binding protein